MAVGGKGERLYMCDGMGMHMEYLRPPAPKIPLFHTHLCGFLVDGMKESPISRDPHLMDDSGGFLGKPCEPVSRHPVCILGYQSQSHWHD